MLKVQLQQQNSMRNAAARTDLEQPQKKAHFEVFQTESWCVVGYRECSKKLARHDVAFKIESQQQYAWDTQVVVAVCTVTARW